MNKEAIIDIENPKDNDLISRQAVQDYVAKYLSQYLYNDVREAVEVIDEYIGELPSVNPQPCEDAIDRAEAIKIASGYCHPANVAKELAKLPPVTPQPKTEQFAKWVATEIFDDMWEYNKDAFAEIACRKLAKLGIVKAESEKK